MVQMAEITEMEILKKWMYCLNAMDITLGSRFACEIPEPIHILLEDVRSDMQYLFALYEQQFHDPTQGSS